MERFIAERFRSFGGGLALDTGAISKYTDLIDLSIGDTDIVTDERIINAAFRDAKAGHTHYCDPHGDPELIDAFCRAWSEDFRQSIEPERVLVTASSCLGMSLVMLGILDPGDEVLVSRHISDVQRADRACWRSVRRGSDLRKRGLCDKKRAPRCSDNSAHEGNDIQ